MENERFELQNVAIPLKWQLPAPKCCKLQGKWIKQQIQNKTKRINTILKKKIRTHMAKWQRPGYGSSNLWQLYTMFGGIGLPVILMWSTVLQVNYISMSAWTDRSSFDKWWSSKSFANMAQASAGMFGPLDHWTIGPLDHWKPNLGGSNATGGGADGCYGGGPVFSCQVQGNLLESVPWKQCQSIHIAGPWVKELRRLFATSTRGCVLPQVPARPGWC